MKKLFSILAIATATLFAVSCSSEYDDTAVWDELGKHNERISKLETLCGQMNTNISSLQAIVTALQNNDYVTGVAPITQNGVEIGYTISFSKSGSITIYHGKDGRDGVNGTDGKDGINGSDGVNGTNGIDGTTPIIGVKQDTDGIYYWTVNGEWLLNDRGEKVKAVGSDGKDGQDGTNGADGADGKDGVDGTNGTDGKDGVNGTNGTDGITPQLKIENDYWYISYDNGASWAQIGKATGEDGQDGANGADGAAGADGDSFFQSVTQDENNVIFTLIDGTVLTLPKSSSYLFNKLQSVSYIPRYEDGKATVYYSAANNSQVEMDFEVSPKDAAAEIAAQWETILSLKAVNTQTRAITYIDMPILGCTADAQHGVITITASGKNLAANFYSGEQTVSARLGISDGNTNITSDFIPLVAQYKQPNNEIWYTSTDGNIVEPHRTYVFGANIISNIYENGKGVITFDSEVTEIGDWAFSDCNSLTSITIPDSVTEISSYAFSDCDGLTNVTIPDSVTEIGYGAFISCYGLTNITIPDSVTKIGSYAFDNCSGLTSVTIPDSVTSIGDLAFNNCRSLTSITIPDSVTEIGNNPFLWCDNLAEFKGKFAADNGRCLIVDGVLNSFAPAGLTTYSIPSNVTEIGYYAFSNCSGLTSVTIPNSVIEIGTNPFENCENLAEFKGKFASEDGRCLIVDGVLRSFAPASLSSYTIPNNVTEIGNSAFKSCNGLTSITIPDSVTKIGEYAFSWCSHLTSITIPNSVTEIGYYAFHDCDGLTSITIPDSVTKIGDYAFYWCYGLTSVFCERTTPPAIEHGVFESNADNRKIYVPAESVDAYKSADGWKDYADSIEPYDFSAVSE